MVYFTLKDNSEEAVQRLLDSSKEHLSGHPGTVLFAAGKRVLDLDREVNDTEFDVALQLVFDSREAQDNYQVHERHLKFIETNRDNWAKVRVFDADVN